MAEEESVLSIDTEFVERLSSSDPTPGGGGAAAYCGAVAGACATMVANITYGNDKYEAVHNQIAESVNRLNDVVSDLLYLVDEDAHAFEPVAKALKLPKGEIRDRKLDEALEIACQTPLRIMQACVSVIDESDFLAHSGAKLLISDVGCAIALAKGALIAGSMNVYTNVRMFKDESKVAQYKDLANSLCEDGCRAADAAYAVVADKLDAYRLV